MSIAHIETSRALRLVDKSFPDLVDLHYKTSQMHRRTLLKFEVKNVSHICGVPRNDAGSYSGLIFHRYSARPLLLAYSMTVGWANQIRMQRIRQDWFVYLCFKMICLTKSPVAQKQVESGSEVIPRCSREPSSGRAEWHENGCLGRRSVGSRQGRTYQTRKRSLVPRVYRTGQTQDVSRAG